MWNMINHQLVNIGVFIILTTVFVVLIVLHVMREKRKKRNENLREFLVFKCGLIKANYFSDERLDNIFREIRRHKKRLRDSPLFIYDLVQRTEDFPKSIGKRR